MQRDKFRISKKELLQEALNNPMSITRELNNRSLYHFLEWCWPIICPDPFESNWHIVELCKELEEIAYRVGNRKPKKHDLLINIPPGTTKTKLVSIIFPVWCWTKWYWMRFICLSFTAPRALESAEESRDIIKSDIFKAVYPELDIKADKDAKSNFRVIKKSQGISNGRQAQVILGGSRLSTSIGGTVTGFHGDIIIWDDPIDPKRAVSETELESTNHWMDNTLPTRKTNKKTSTVIGIMQRLGELDPSQHLLDKKKKNLRHLCIPGEIRNYREQVSPKRYIKYYVNDLLDPNRLGWKILKELEVEIGQYGFAGQVGQKPTPPAGGMFKTDRIITVDMPINPERIEMMVRCWDKAGTEGGGAYTAGVKMYKLTNGQWVIADVIRGQWSSEVRETKIRDTAFADGIECHVVIEQEPGSGGKESAEGTVRNLEGFTCKPENPTGNKAYRADPFSVQVNDGKVWMLKGDWNEKYKDELKHFPNSKYKDQVDGSSGAYNYLINKREARRVS